MNIVEACGKRSLFGPWFRDPTTWAPWIAFLKALFALPMSAADLALYRECTGRAEPPALPPDEAWLVVGRRGGKSFVVALIAVFLACFQDWSPYLSPGERATVMVLAADRRQARTIFRYARALLEQTPLAKLVTRITQEEIDLASGVSIEIHTASFRATRGYTVVAALLDEVAFWRSDESANPDVEILNAIRPAMSTVPGAMLLGISSPYARRGVLWEAFDRHHGREGPVLVWQAPTRTMNPTVPQDVIDRAYETDPARAAAEYGAEFRSDVEGFLDLDLLRPLTRAEPRELPPLPGERYHAFADPSGGRHDAFALAIAHRDASDRIVLDLVRGRRPPFDPAAVVAEFAALLGDYDCRVVAGDRYAGAWVAEAFRSEGVEYRPAARPKSELYMEVLPLFTRGIVELPDDPLLLTELASLERRPRPGRDVVDHPSRGHDDLANAAAGAILAAAERQAGISEDALRGWLRGLDNLRMEPRPV